MLHTTDKVPKWSAPMNIKFGFKDVVKQTISNGWYHAWNVMNTYTDYVIVTKGSQRKNEWIV